jgi:1-acyl-sn-glycerol-3-phosphate acyltransferase
MRPEIRGIPPEAPFFLVTNHLGYMDVILLASCTPSVFVSKAEVAGWPVLGRFCRSVDTIFLDREFKRDLPRVVEEIDEVLRGERGIVVFPEGTSTRGETVLPFRPSLLEVPVRAGLSVSWAALSYRTPPGERPADRSVCWWGGAGFVGHFLGLLGLPWFAATVAFGEEPVVESDRKRLADRLRRSVRNRLRTISGRP